MTPTTLGKAQVRWSFQGGGDGTLGSLSHTYDGR